MKCLNDLLKYRDETGKLSPIITGYNGYVQVPATDRAITFSHIHEDENYRSAMFSDLEKLGYSQEFIQEADFLIKLLAVGYWVMSVFCF